MNLVFASKIVPAPIPVSTQPKLEPKLAPKLAPKSFPKTQQQLASMFQNIGGSTMGCSNCRKK